MSPRSAHIVIVEDEPVTRRALARYLESFGYKVSECESAEKADKILSQGNVDLLIADINLEGKDGLEITIKLDSGQIIAVTQEADEQVRAGERVRVLSGSGVTRVSH